MVQLLWDRSDPNGYAHHITDDPLPGTPSHKVLMQVALGDHQVANVTAEVEARTIGARLRTPAVDAGRSFDKEPFYGIKPIRWFPFDGSAFVMFDTGPVRPDGNGGVTGTPPPPIENLPPREGRDPHSAPRSDVNGRVQKSDVPQDRRPRDRRLRLAPVLRGRLDRALAPLARASASSTHSQ